MPIFLLTNWRWLAPLAGMAVLGILLGVSRIEVADDRATIAKTALAIQAQKTEAAAQLVKFNAETAAKDQAYAELARNSDALRTQDLAQIDSTRADFSKQLTDGLRKQAARCGGGGGKNLPGPAADAGKPQNPSTGSDGGRAGIDPESVLALRDTALKLQADVKMCVSWANGVGR